MSALLRLCLCLCYVIYKIFKITTRRANSWHYELTSVTFVGQSPVAGTRTLSQVEDSEKPRVSFINMHDINSVSLHNLLLDAPIYRSKYTYIR